jgi:mannose-1-phosphate guanylyltransferase / phosphomannomutase
MRAVVMAGGQGTRLRPLTSNQPKPMLPIVGQPMMQHVLSLARSHGITDIVATVQFLASVVRNYFGDGSAVGVALDYATEEEPLGTAGSVKNAESFLDDRFVVLSGDALTDIDLSEVIRFHEERGAAVTVTLKRVEDPLEFGIVILGEDGRVERFLEKPGWGDVFSDTINTGIYVIERAVLDFVPAGEAFDFSQDLFPLLLDKGLPLYGFVSGGFWTDVGTVEAYMAAHVAVLDRGVDVQIEGFELREGVWVGEGAEIDPEVMLDGPAFIGENSRLEGGAEVRSYSVLGRDVSVKSGALVHRSVVHDHAYIGSNSIVRGSVIGANTDVKFGAKVEEAIIADQCHIGEGAVIHPQVKVYPFKWVDPGAIVSSSIVWQSGGPRGLFGERGVSGLVNIDITPEVALRLALAYGSMLPKGSRIVSCRDVTRAARILKRAMIAGANAGGLDCHDLELVPTPVARFYAASARAVGGFAVRTAQGDPSSVEIQFFDERGVDIDPAMQRRLERAYYRDDLRRAFHHDFGELNFPARGRDYYVRGLLDRVDVAAVQRRRPKLVVDYAFGGATLTGPAVLGRLGGQVLAVNAVLDEERAVLSREDTEAHLEAVARLVRSSGAELGALIDSPGERIKLIDGSGRTLDAETALLAYVWLVTSAAPTRDGDDGRGSPAPVRVAAPVNAPAAVERIVRERGGELTWTRVSPVALMGAAADGGVTFAGGSAGGYIFPDFIPAYDAIMSLAKLLDLLSAQETTLAGVVDLLPSAHVVRIDVPVAWQAKGTVMRRLLERVGDGAVTIDGIKLYRGPHWVLVVPHPVEPIVRVWAEADGEASADELAREFAGLVEELKE